MHTYPSPEAFRREGIIRREGILLPVRAESQYGFAHVEADKKERFGASKRAR
jgi:hypothetical protein